MRILSFLSITLIFVILKSSNSYAQLPESVKSAYQHLKQQFDQYHSVSYVYDDDNCGGNIFIPSNWQGKLKGISINQADTNSPVFKRSCTKIILPRLDDDTAFSAVKYVYPADNNGDFPGFDLGRATKLKFKAKGSGIVEFTIGGANRKPFYNNSNRFQDGVDFRSSGFVRLTNDWKEYFIDLIDNTFWVYKSSALGASSIFSYPELWSQDGCNPTFKFVPFAQDDGNTCMKVITNDNCWGGVVLRAQTDPGQGCDLSGIRKVHFKAKIIRSDNYDQGGVTFIFGQKVASKLVVTSSWKDYALDIPSSEDVKNVSVGFGFIFDGSYPKMTQIFVDDIYYEGVTLANDFSKTICGFGISESKLLNPNGATVYLDSVYYDKSRLDQPRFCQSYVSGSETFDLTMKNRADVYDNALLLITNLTLFETSQCGDMKYLNDAKILGNAFMFAMYNDRIFNDNRLRNSYTCGDLKSGNANPFAKLPGWWDTDSLKWFEDPSCVSTSTGNIAWAGLALTSLYEVTLDGKYLGAAQDLANWCIKNMKDSINIGFTGGFEGWEPGSEQKKISWKSTEHNIDLFALFTRLDKINPSPDYHSAAINAKDFVLSMWNSVDNHFWTGTDNSGITPNTNNIPLDIQAWYIMAFEDSVSKYSKSILWANDNCKMTYKSPNYDSQLTGFDFNTDRDGIWPEGTAQAALANAMIGNHSLSDSVLSSIEYIQTHHNNPKFYNFNSQGIVAATENYTTTGFEWNYFNRLHVGATCWYILSKLHKNPYYYAGCKTLGLITNENIGYQFDIYPNPFARQTIIKYSIPERSHVSINLYDPLGNEIKSLANILQKSGNYELTFDASDLNPGIYYCQFRSGKYSNSKKMILIR